MLDTAILAATINGVTSVLSQGTALLQAGTQLVGQLHDLIAPA